MELVNIPFKVCFKCGCSSTVEESEYQGSNSHEQRRRWECGLRVAWMRYLDNTDTVTEEICQESPCQTAHREGLKKVQEERDQCQSEVNRLYDAVDVLSVRIQHLDDQLAPLVGMGQLDKVGNLVKC